MLRKNYGFIDFAKVYCALLVVFIHAYDVRTSSLCDAILCGVTNQAVPFFFMVSGFFFGGGIKIGNHGDNGALVKKKCIHYFLVYLAWCLICIVSIIKTYSDESFVRMIILILRRILFAGYSVYWYLLVLAESFFIIYFVFKMNTKGLMAASICGLTLGIVYDLNISSGIFGFINQVFYVIFSWNNNVVMKGIPFVAIGILISDYKNRIKINKWCLIVLYLLVNILGIVLYRLGVYKISAFIFQPEAILLFLICIGNSQFSLSDKHSRMVQGFSSCLYYLHPFIIWAIIEQIWSAHSPFGLKYFGAVLISLVVFAGAWLINKKPINWLLSIKH